MEIITKSAEETFEVARKFGADLIHSTTLKARVLALSGEMGAGKTTFVQGLAKGLGIKNKIVSPTFILMRSYDKLYHLDLYRLEGDIEKQVRDLGLFDLMEDSKNVIVIEWAEKIQDLLPKNTIYINFDNLENNERRIVINA